MFNIWTVNECQVMSDTPSEYHATYGSHFDQHILMYTVSLFYIYQPPHS